MPTLTITDKRESRTESFEVKDVKNEPRHRVVVIDANDVARFLGITSRFPPKDLFFMMGGDYEPMGPLEAVSDISKDYTLHLRKKN